MRNLMIESQESTERSFRQSRVDKKFCILYAVSALTIGLLVGVSLTYGVMRDNRTYDLISDDVFHAEDIRKSLFNSIDSKRIGVLLKTLTKRPYTGEQDLDDNTMFVYNKWTDLGLNTTFANYSVLMSYQNPLKPNSIRKYDKSGQIIFNSSQFENPLNAPSDKAEYYRLNPPFLAYSQSTDKPLKGTPVYVNYGRTEDYEHLKSIGVNVSRHIVIARFGSIFRANIVRLAEDNGAIGVIIYTDPYDYTDGNADNTYPKSVYLPETGVQRGTVQIGDGDPQTPFYPSIKSAYRLPIDETDIPRIPAQSISYGDAKYILEGLKGQKAPDDWIGGLNISYNIGPEYEDQSYLTLEVNTYLKQSTIHNVIGVIQGCTEPDRYVLIGNHRDAWTFGAADPLSGTAAMLELSEAFTTVMKTEKWCPRRSVVFCSWAAEEYGLIGSTEWVEENQKLLAREAVAYLNVDIAVQGNFTFQAKAVPLLYSTIFKATDAVLNPNPKEVEEELKTVYDSYLKHRPANSSPYGADHPNVETPGSGSDHSPFLQRIGVPVVDFYYDCDKSSHIKCYPMYHSMYETFDLMSNLTDNGFNYTRALTQVWAEMLRLLSDSPLLPFSMSLNFYPIFLENALKELINSQYNSVFIKHNISLDFLEEAITEFGSAVNEFSEELSRVENQNELMLRRANDIMMSIERAFIDGQGLPYRKDYQHIVLAPSALNAYSGSSFPGLYDLLWKYRQELNESKQSKLLIEIEKHLSVIVFHINSAKLLVKQTFV